MFRLLFIGDVVGEAGCKAVGALVPALREELGLDAVVANGENSAPGGRGITPQTGDALLSKVDFLTLGNHTFDAKGAEEFLSKEKRVVRPANMDSRLPGQGQGIFNIGNVQVGVANVQGRVFMRDDLPSPFVAADQAVSELEDAGVDLILVDVHGEATSEKQAIGYHLAGRVQAIVGTHTHVPTADAKILFDTTAYISDVGMTGVLESIIGFDKKQFMRLFLEEELWPISPAEGPSVLSGVLIEFDVGARRAVNIEYLRREID